MQNYRLSPLPPNWQTLRVIVLKRDNYICQLQIPNVCTVVAKEVHHAIAHDDHRVEALLSVCSECHKIETHKQAAAARWKFRNARPKGKHPGLM